MGEPGPLRIFGVCVVCIRGLRGLSSGGCEAEIPAKTHLGAQDGRHAVGLGYNEWGQLGIGNTTGHYQYRPVQVVFP